jgi:uncharacterized damage-inducible protein DinB
MLRDFAAEFAKYKTLGEQTLAQLSDEMLNYVPGPQANSIAMIVSHLHGNLLSRFTDFLTTDGEKPWRSRETEFAGMRYTRSEIETKWNAGWTQLERTLAEMTDNDLPKRVTIKGKEMTADRALCRALAHVAYHLGQIVLLGRQVRGEQWQYLSTPREKSRES